MAAGNPKALAPVVAWESLAAAVKRLPMVAVLQEERQEEHQEEHQVEHLVEHLEIPVACQEEEGLVSLVERRVGHQVEHQVLVLVPLLMHSRQLVTQDTSPLSPGSSP